FFGKFSGGEQRRTVNSVAARFCADVNHGIADAFGFGEKDFFLFGDAERERVDKRILRIARLEGDFAADGGNAETVSVTSDAADDAVEDAAVFRGICFASALARSDFPEAKRVEDGDGPRAHGENVAQDAADAGGRALKRLNITRMIVRFDFEGRNEAVANVDDAGVFSRALHHELPACGQALQVDFTRFIGAVLAPHHAKDAQLGDVRVAAKDLLNARVLLAGDAMFGGDFGGHSNFGASSGHVSDLQQRTDTANAALHAVALAAPTSASTMERKMTRPSEEPRAHSTARSGWGIRPATLRSRLQTPAIL